MAWEPCGSSGIFLMIVAPPSPLSDPSINKVDVMTPFLIGQLCAAKNGTLAATANFAIEFESYLMCAVSASSRTCARNI
jgi:hypothetical protein